MDQRASWQAKYFRGKTSIMEPQSSCYRNKLMSSAKWWQILGFWLQKWDIFSGKNRQTKSDMNRMVEEKDSSLVWLMATCMAWSAMLVYNAEWNQKTPQTIYVPHFANIHTGLHSSSTQCTLNSLWLWGNWRTWSVITLHFYVLGWKPWELPWMATPGRGDTLSLWSCFLSVTSLGSSFFWKCLSQ